MLEEVRLISSLATVSDFSLDALFVEVGEIMVLLFWLLVSDVEYDPFN